MSETVCADNHYSETVARVGFFLAYECLTCGRVRQTDIDLRHKVRSLVGTA